MAVDHIKPGCVEATIYFKHHKTGKIQILPTVKLSRQFRVMLEKLGFEWCVADTLQQVEKLQGELQEQLYHEQQAELIQDDLMTRQRRQAVRDRLIARANAAGTPALERDFIMMWIERREINHAAFQKRFTSQIGILPALEYNNSTKHIHDLHDRVPDSQGE